MLLHVFLSPTHVFFLLLCCVLSKLACMGYFRVGIYGLGFWGRALFSLVPLAMGSFHVGFYGFIFFFLRGETD